MHKTDDLQYCCDDVSFPKKIVQTGLFAPQIKTTETTTNYSKLQKVSETTFFNQSGIVGNLFVKLFRTIR